MSHRYSLSFRWGIGMVNIYDSDKACDLEMEYDYYDYYLPKFGWTWEQFVAERFYEYDSSDFDETIKNRSFMLILGYRF